MRFRIVVLKLLVAIMRGVYCVPNFGGISGIATEATDLIKEYEADEEISMRESRNSRSIGSAKR